MRRNRAEIYWECYKTKSRICFMMVWSNKRRKGELYGKFVYCYVKVAMPVYVMQLCKNQTKLERELRHCWFYNFIELIVLPPKRGVYCGAIYRQILIIFGENISCLVLHKNCEYEQNRSRDRQNSRLWLLQKKLSSRNLLFTELLLYLYCTVGTISSICFKPSVNSQITKAQEKGNVFEPFKANQYP